MRKIIAIVLALALLGAAALAESAPGNRLGYKVLSQLSGGSQNALVSPVSLAWALSMAAEGAAGETRQKLLKALDVDDPQTAAELSGPLKDAGLMWANAAFIGAGIELKPDYAAILSERYGAGLFELPDSEAANAWASDATGGLIDHLAVDPAAGGQLTLANAAVLQAEWASPFDPSMTREDAFHTPDGDVTVPFMSQDTYAQYGESMGVQLVSKGYMNGRLAMVLALPPEGGLKRALKNLEENPNSFFTFKPNPQNVRLRLPKLDMSGEASLKDAIVAAGCWVPFHEEYADYSGISEADLKVTDVFQQVRVQVDEEGTRAAAVTEVELSDTAVADEGPQPIDFTVDRPFLFALVDRPTGAVLFAGAVVNPVG